MILETGSKVLIVHRRLFENDRARFFVGVVDAYENGVAKVRGSTWLRDPIAGDFFKKEDLRTKIVAISSGTLLVYELEADTDLTAVRFETTKDGKVVLTDGKRLRADLSESEHVTVPVKKKR